MSNVIQRIHLLALMSAPIFHDTKSGYLLVKLNSQVDDQDSIQDPQEPLFPEFTGRTESKTSELVKKITINSNI